MSLLVSLGLIVSSPIILAPSVPPEEGSPLAQSCEAQIERLDDDRDSTSVEGAGDSVIRNEAMPECGDTRTIYETNLVHRSPLEVTAYPVKRVILPDGTESVQRKPNTQE